MSSFNSKRAAAFGLPKGNPCITIKYSQIQVFMETRSALIANAAWENASEDNQLGPDDISDA